MTDDCILSPVFAFRCFLFPFFQAFRRTWLQSESARVKVVVEELAVKIVVQEMRQAR